jgi:hypothetical protein
MNRPRCACKHPDARECYLTRYRIEVDDRYKDDGRCECSCHVEDEDGFNEWDEAAAEADEADAPGWCCPCGMYVESHFHCPSCGGEPPWGCDCGEHDEYEPEGWEDPLFEEGLP